MENITTCQGHEKTKTKTLKTKCKKVEASASVPTTYLSTEAQTAVQKVEASAHTNR